MKPTLLKRLAGRLRGPVRHTRKGVAILTVLAIITLMTVLVLSFFNMAQTSKTTAKGSVEIQRVTTLKDTIINLVIAQFREASRLTPQGNSSNPRNIITWTSQPGAIRTYSATDVTKNKIFKLYSSDVPQIDNIAAFDIEKVLDGINGDLEGNWAIKPDEFVDMNRPVYSAATGDRASATGSTDPEGYFYPIADPRRYNGRDGDASRGVNTEGFKYSQNSRGKIIQGVDARNGELAMPVRWIYILEDGTLGYLDRSGEFTTLNGEGGGKVSRENPIVGRLAWWADDESSKINVNTASVPAVWDTPRTTSQEDVLLGQNQPIAGEYQRYPGHPATVDLSAVFYPGQRWTPYPEVVPPGGTMRALQLDDAVRIWDVAPFIVGNSQELRSGGTLGSLGGSNKTPNGAMVGASTDDRIFTSLDELYFKAAGAGNVGLSKPRGSMQSEGTDKSGEFLQRLEQSGFFLTHKSHSPELTNQGFPRVSMWPMNPNAASQVGTTGSSLPAGVSPYDVTVAANSTIARRQYYLQREDPNSRHNEFFSNFSGRNVAVFRYLKNLSMLPIPGYPEIKPYTLSPGLPPADEPADSRGLSFASKYPAGWNPIRNQRYTNSTRSGADPMDASDRTQILLDMLDFTRSINLNSVFLAAGAKYDGGYGQASGMCGCRGAGGNNNTDHTAAMAYPDPGWRAPKGTGKRYGVTEITMLVNLAGRKDATGATSGAWGALAPMLNGPSATLANKENQPGTRYIVEVGFIASAFNPKHGWSHQYPSGGITISTLKSHPTNQEDARSTTGTGTSDPLPFYINSDGTQEFLSINRAGGAAPVSGDDLASGSNEDRKVPPGVIPYGGYTGIRTFFTQNGAGNSIAMTRPVCIVDLSGQSQLNVGLTSPGGMMRVMTYDGNAGNYNTLQSIELEVPVGFTNGLTAAYTGKSLRELARTWAAANAQFPPAGSGMRSFVVPHGDYRLTTIPIRIDAGTFVPHVNAMAGGQRAFSFFEMNSDPLKRSFAGDLAPSGGIAYSLDGSIVDRSLVSNQPNPRQTGLINTIPLGLPDPKETRSAAARNDPGWSASAEHVALASRSTASVTDGLTRQELFSHGRKDGHGKLANRGSSDPTETGDFDQGVGAAPDGPYMNYPDEGDRRGTTRPYFDNLTANPGNALPAQRISPNFLVRSPVDFGSIPTGIQCRVPWQTLRFRPDPLMNNPQYRMEDSSDAPPPGLPFANFCGPRDHFFLDMFWMPVVEPWSISEPFSTKGTINLNQQIFPFLYIERTTALHALLRGERMLAIPNEAGDKYKSPSNNDPTYRYYINPEETVRQFTMRYNDGVDIEGQKLAFNTFRSASEICELWLVPDKNGNPYDGSNPWTLEYVSRRQGIPSNQAQRGFWDEHLLTGDNSRERPYSNLYPRVTVRSNVFKLHLIAQTLQKAKSTSVSTFNSVTDLVTAEWRGSCMIERSINPRDTALNNIDYTNLNAATMNQNTTPKLDRFYTFRVTEVKQLTQ